VAFFSFKLDQLFMLLVPKLVVDVAVAVTLNFPDEVEFVQKLLSINSKVAVDMISRLHANPHPQRLILLVTAWHHAMAIGSFKLDKLLMLHVPFLILFRHGSQKALLMQQKWVDDVFGGNSEKESDCDDGEKPARETLKGFFDANKSHWFGVFVIFPVR
jgi:hypothetical protein